MVFTPGLPVPKSWMFTPKTLLILRPENVKEQTQSRKKAEKKNQGFVCCLLTYCSKQPHKARAIFFFRFNFPQLVNQTAFRGWGDGPVSKALVVQTGETEFGAPEPR